MFTHGLPPSMMDDNAIIHDGRQRQAGKKTSIFNDKELTAPSDRTRRVKVMAVV
jgi:hypothetical protein